jgi:protease IV
MKKYLTKHNIKTFSLGIIFTLVIGVSIYLLDGKGPKCNIQGIKLHGNLVTYKLPDIIEDITSSEEVIHLIRSANDNKNIKAIVIDIDSSGGSTVAGEEISNAIKNSEKPVISYIRDLGASASYWAISSSDKIYSSSNSRIGSVGVTVSYLSQAEKNKKDGLKYEKISSGKYKDMASPDIDLTNEERNILLRDVNISFNNFMNDISINRNIPLDEVKKFSDGSMVLGEKAIELGLVDEIGDLYLINNYLSEFIKEPLYMCWE